MSWMLSLAAWFSAVGWERQRLPTPPQVFMKLQGKDHCLILSHCLVLSGAKFCMSFLMFWSHETLIGEWDFHHCHKWPQGGRTWGAWQGSPYPGSSSSWRKVCADVWAYNPLCLQVIHKLLTVNRWRNQGLLLVFSPPSILVEYSWASVLVIHPNSRFFC